MKKLGVVLILVLLLIAVLFSAGCISEKSALEDKSVLHVTVTKDGGHTYCVGDTMTVNLPNYPDEGYGWYITYSDGFDYKKNIITPNEAGVGDAYSSYTSFVFTPTKEGTSFFVAKFMEEGDESTAIYGYEDNMNVNNTLGHTTSTFTFYGNMEPSRGDYVSIVYQKSESNQDYTYETNKNHMTDGLTLLNTTTLSPESIYGGAYGGAYGGVMWTVTAKEIGDYYFGVEEVDPSGKVSENYKFYLRLHFKK